MIATPGATIAVQCFTDQIDDETLGPWIDVRGRMYLTFYVTGKGTLDSGVISFEEAAPKNLSEQPPVVFGADTGNYTSITTVNAVDVTGGKQKAIHITVAHYCFVRARISTVIAGAGGSVSVGLIAA